MQDKGKPEHEEDLEPSPNFLGKISTEKNSSDLGTKPVDHQRHWDLMNRMKFQSLENIRALSATSSSVSK